MLRTVFFAIGFLQLNLLFAQDTIKYTGFEGDTLEWRGSGIGNGQIADPSSLLIGDTTSGYADNPPRQRIASGKRSWQIINAIDTIRLDSIPIFSYDSVKLSLRFSGTSLSLVQGLDIDDSIKIFVAVNGASFLSVPTILITGNSIGFGNGNGTGNDTWGFGADSIIQTRSDTNIIYKVPGGFLDTNNTASTAIIHFLPGTLSVRVMIVAKNNQSEEVWNIDDLFLIGNLKQSLSLNLASFQLNKYDKGVEIEWSVASEPRDVEYAIERSKNGNVFVQVGVISNTSTDDNFIHRYTYFDPSPEKAWNYYRIKQLFVNGSFEHSEIKSIYVHSGNSTIIYPTIVNNYLNVSSNQVDIQRYQIVDSHGKLVKSGKINLQDLNAQIPLPDFTPGVYFISLISNQNIQTLPFIKN